LLSRDSSADEVDHNEVKDHVCKQEVGKTALGRDRFKLGLVRWVHLESKADAEDEGGDGGDEPREESVEGEGAHQATVEELEDPGEEDVGQVGINDLQLLGSL